MTQTTIRPIAFLASAALVSMLWFQTLAIPQAATQSTVTLASVA